MRRFPPERIVCLTEETVETLYLLSEENRIVGVSGYAVRPPRVRREKPGVSAFTSADTAKIVALTPDLVLAFSDLQVGIGQDLAHAGLAVHLFNQRDVAGILAMVRTLGALIDRRDAADTLADSLARRLEAIAREQQHRSPWLFSFSIDCVRCITYDEGKVEQGLARGTGRLIVTRASHVLDYEGETRDEPRRTVEEIVNRLGVGNEIADAADSIVALLRRADYGILDLLAIAHAAKEKVAQTWAARPDELLRRLRAIDNLLHLCIARTSAIHEQVLEESLRAYVEIDRDGRVIFANPIMRKLLPDVGRVDLASLFGKDAAYVRDALAGRAPRRVRRLYLQHQGLDQPRLVSGEFGPLRGGGESVAYAIIVDLQAFEAADHKLYEAHPAGIAKLDLEFRIAYVNEELLRLSGLPRGQLLGQIFDDLFPDPQSQRRLVAAKTKLEGGDGQEVELCLEGSQTSPVSVTLIPMFDDQGERTHLIVTVRSLAVQKARLAIHLACQQDQTHEAILRAVTDIIRPFISFQFAGFYIYDESMGWARPTCILPQPEPPWPTNWFQVTEDLHDWLFGEATFAPDMVSFVRERPERDRVHGSDPTFLRLVEEGCHAFICVPLRQGDRIEAALSLVSRDIDAYGAEDLELLRELGIDNALRVILSAYRRSEHMLAADLNKTVGRASSIAEMAEGIVHKLTGFYGWQNVSFLLINRLNEAFEVLAESAGPVDGFSLSPAFKQPLSEGLLGECLRRQSLVLLNNTENTEDPLTRIFRRGHMATRSELVMPIRVSGRVQFLINVEDRRVNAFQQPEVDALTRLIAEFEKMLEQRRLDMILEEVLQAANDGIVITDLEGNIDRCNRKALRLLQLDLNADGGRAKTIGEMLRNPEDREACERIQDFPRRHVVITGADGQQRAVLLTSKILGDEFNQRVFFLEDVKELQWQYDMRAIRTALAEVAQQTRVPLAVAGSLVRRVARRVRNDPISEGVGEALDTCIRQLGRINLTFDRVVANAQAPQAGDSPFDPEELSWILERVRLELPPPERKMIQVTERCTSLPPVLAKRGALTFVFRSLLAHLLWRASSETPIIADAEPIDDSRNARILLRARAVNDGPTIVDDSISAMECQAWADAAYADAGIRVIVEDQLKGRFTRRCDGAGEEVFELVLPLAVAEREPAPYIERP